MRLDGTDPDGAGINEQKINKEGQALTFSTNQSELEHESEENGAAYIWASDSVNPAIDDTVLLVKNTSDNHLHIDSILISGETDSEYTVHLPTSEVTPTGGSVVTGTNLNTTSSLEGSVVATLNTSGLVIGKNKSIGIDVVANTVLSSVSITGHYEV